MVVPPYVGCGRVRKILALVGVVQPYPSTNPLGIAENCNASYEGKLCEWGPAINSVYNENTDYSPGDDGDSARTSPNNPAYG